ncbi:MAG: methyltransferase domain-containing protein [Desulfovermiculus sp.]
MHQHSTPTQRLAAWEREPYGRFGLEQEKCFLLHLASEWRRRHRKVLQIECGNGLLLEPFWEAGFDLSATASNPADVHKTRTRIGRRAELHLAHPTDLPFEDKSFDYVLLITALDYCSQPAHVLQEAARVCAKEMLISFLNKHSLYALTLVRGNAFASTSKPVRWWSWPSMKAFVGRYLGSRPVCAQGGILPGPYKSWQSYPLYRTLNNMLCPNIFGAYAALRLDMTADHVLTPLPAWVQPRPKPSTPCSQRGRTSASASKNWSCSPQSFTKAKPHASLRQKLPPPGPESLTDHPHGAGCATDRT